MRAEQLLPDETNRLEFNGTMVRKGTVGAFLSNVRVWRDAATCESERVQAEADMQLALPALHALGIFELFEFRDPALRKWVDSH